MNTQEFDSLRKLVTGAQILGAVPVSGLYLKKVEALVLTMREIAELNAEDQEIYDSMFSRFNRRAYAGETNDYLHDLASFYETQVKNDNIEEIIKVKKDMLIEGGEDIVDFPTGVTQTAPFIVYNKGKVDVPEPTQVIASLPKPPGIELYKEAYSLPRKLHINRGGYIFSLKDWSSIFSGLLLKVHKKIQNHSVSSGYSDRSLNLAQQWENEKFLDSSMANSGVSPNSYSLTNPKIHRPTRENIEDPQVDNFIRDMHIKYFKENPSSVDAAVGAVSMKLGKATGLTLYSRIKHGEWNVGCTALAGILGHSFSSGALGIDFVKKYHPWGKYYPLAIEGQRFSASDICNFNSQMMSGHPRYSHSLIFFEGKPRMIGNVPKELQVTTRQAAKWMQGSLRETHIYATSKEHASSEISSWETDDLVIFNYDLEKMDKGYTESHNKFAVSCYPNKKWQEDLWVENSVNTLCSSRKGLDEYDVLKTGHLIMPSGANDTSYGNTNVNLREYLKAVKFAYGYDYTDRCPEDILKIACSRVMISGDDLITAVESNDIKDKMKEYFDKYSNWNVKYSDLPVFLSIFFAEGKSFNSVIRCINNHFEGEHAKEHPLILTMSLGSHFKLLKDSPFYQIWIEAMNEFLSAYPLYCLCQSVEECGDFIDSEECKHLMMEYSTSGQKAADDIRDLLRGFVYSFTPDDSLSNQDFFLDLLFALEENQPEMTINIVKSSYYNKDIEKLLISAFENPFKNNYEVDRKVICTKLRDMNIFRIDNKAQSLYNALKNVGSTSRPPRDGELYDD